MDSLARGSHCVHLVHLLTRFECAILFFDSYFLSFLSVALSCLLGGVGRPRADNAQSCHPQEARPNMGQCEGWTHPQIFMFQSEDRMPAFPPFPTAAELIG